MSSETIRPSAAPLMGLAHLMRRAFAGEDLQPLGAKLIARAQADIWDPEALIDLSTVLHLSGNPELALSVQEQALAIRCHYRLPAPNGRPGIQLLALMAPGDLSANMPLEALLEDSEVDLEMLYLVPGQPFPESVPDHDVAIVAMSESDANKGLLQELKAIAPFWPRPILNPPDKVDQLSRDGVARLLPGLPGISMPISVRASRDEMEAMVRGKLLLTDKVEEGFPLIVRPLDSHAGHGLERVVDMDALKAYLEANPAENYYLSPFVDYVSEDGQYRKYRIVLIQGRPYAGHMAISSHWMIHYLNAGMVESAEKRDEEARFMADFDKDFAVRHGAALAAIQDCLGLDYLGIDCGETREGKLLVFEVDHAMIVHAMDPVDLFPYKQPQMKKVFAAFRHLLEDSRKGLSGR